MKAESFTYPVVLTPAKEGGFVVTFPDVPGAITDGETETEAVANAIDALETMFIAYIRDKQDIPRPSAPRDRRTIAVSPIAAAKVALYRAMREHGLTKAGLARRLGLHAPQVDRLLDLRHASRLDQLADALRVLGKELVLSVRDAA
jgi:antitoxin HicB